MQSPSYELIPEIMEMTELKHFSDLILDGEFKISPSVVMNNILNAFLSEFSSLSRYLIIFISLGLLATVMDLYGKSSSSDVGNASFYALYAAVASVGIQCYCVCLGYATEVIGDITDFVTKLSPMLMTLIISTGKPLTASTLYPVLSGGIFIISIICKKCLLPLTSYSVVLSVADNIGDKIRVSGFCKLLNSSAKWIMMLSFTVFTGICSIYGFSSPKLDILGVKTVKFAVGSLVPVVGGFLAETLETVVSGAGIMKNTIGVAGLAVMCVICFVPVLKIGVMAFVVRLCSAVTEAVSDKRIAAFLGSISSSITTLFGVVATVVVLFIINISIIIAVTG